MSFGARYGAYWKPGSQVHGGAHHQPSHVTGLSTQQAGAQQARAAPHRAQLAALQNASATGGNTIPIAFTALAVSAGPSDSYPGPSYSIEDTGVKVGEILGWRAWRIEYGWLYSMTADFEWKPGEIVEAHKIGPATGDGVHAFKQRRQPFREYTSGDNCYFSACCLAIGQIQMWGQIYEFEGGWHAEFAKIHSIDSVVNHPDEQQQLMALREAYGLI